MDKDLILLLNDILGEDVEELEEEEIEEIEDALSGEQQKELQSALQTFFDNSEEVPNAVNKAAAVLTKIIITLAAETEEEEEGGKKKVKKSPSWGFTLIPPSDED